jgi:hypothetical protein
VGGLGLGGGPTTPPPATWSWRGQTNILALNIHITYDCIQIVTKMLKNNVRNENKRLRRMRGMKLSAVGEGM